MELPEVTLSLGNKLDSKCGGEDITWLPVTWGRNEDRNGSREAKEGMKFGESRCWHCGIAENNPGKIQR